MDGEQLLSVKDQLIQLEQARSLVLGDSSYYAQIVQGILPIVGQNARIEIKRWGADFLAEAFASPQLPQAAKANLALSVLIHLGDLLAESETGILKAAIQCCTSIYPWLFKYIVDTPGDAESWKVILGLKSKTFALWDVSRPSVSICCVKFAQRVIMVQTPGEPVDPRRRDQGEISSLLVPRQHPLLSPSVLEAEASGLLDRILSILQEHSSDALLVTATLNCLGPLARCRPLLATKIIEAVLSFNPLKLANSPMTPQIRVYAKSMERTARSLLLNYLKKNQDSLLAMKIRNYIENSMQSSAMIFSDTRKKRGFVPDTMVDEANKHPRLQAGPALAAILPLPPGPVSYAQLFTITEDHALSAFDVTQLPNDLLVQILVPILRKLDPSLLDRAIEGIRARYDELKKQAWPQGIDDDDDYEPDFHPMEDDEQILNKLDAAPLDSLGVDEPDEYLGKLELAHPPRLTGEENAIVSQGIVARLFAALDTLPDATPKTLNSGFNRVAASTHDKMSWLTVITRIATRSTFGLEDQAVIKQEPGEDVDIAAKPNIAELIRDMLYRYIMEDFRRRIDVAVMWLNEEWYNDQLLLRANAEHVQLQYSKWSLKVIEGMLPYLDASDKKVLTRFLSEIPEDTPEILARVKTLCLDPERVQLAIIALQYLTMLKIPARKACLDVLEDLWRNYDDARPAAEKILKRWRPEALVEEVEGMNGTIGNGITEAVSVAAGS